MVENLHFVFINKDLLLDWRLTEFSQFTNFNHISEYIEIPRLFVCEEDAVECVHVQPYQLHHEGGLDEFVPDRGYKCIHIDVVLNKDGEQFVDLVSLVTAYVVVGVTVRGHLVPHTAKELLEGGGQQVLEASMAWWR